MAGMYFALATDDLALYVFADFRALASCCEGIDVDSGGWLFWADDGTSLKARFTEPVERSGRVAGGGAYVLEENASGEHLAQCVHKARTLDANPFFRTLEAVGAYIGR